MSIVCHTYYLQSSQTHTSLRHFRLITSPILQINAEQHIRPIRIEVNGDIDAGSRDALRASCSPPDQLARFQRSGLTIIELESPVAPGSTLDFESWWSARPPGTDPRNWLTIYVEAFRTGCSQVQI
jgi:hypothetical protein